MSDGENPSGSGPGKIVLIVVGVVVGLVLLCCGILAFLARDKIGPISTLITSSASFQQRLATDIGPGTMMTFGQDDEGMVILVGVPGGPKDDQVAALQDKSWRAYCECFASGGMKVTGVAIGTAGTPGSTTPIVKWKKHLVSLEDLEARTGAKAPPVLKMLEGMDGRAQVKVQVGTGDEPDTEDKDKQK